MSTHNSTWKNFEKQVAEFFGSHRNILSGANRMISASDSMHEGLFIEAKLRSSHPLIERYEKEFKDGLVVSIDHAKYDYNLLAFGSDTFPELAQKATHMVDKKGRLRVRQFLEEIKPEKVKVGRNVFPIFYEASLLAQMENKIPLVAVKLKYKKGWIAVVRVEDVHKFHQYLPN